jgi:putative hemolysin
MLLELFVLGLALACVGLLAMSEMAITSARRGRLQKLVQLEKPGANAALKLLDSGEDLQAFFPVAIAFLLIFYGVFGGAFLVRNLDAWLSALSPAWNLPGYYTSFALVVLSLTFLSMLFGTLIPRRLAQVNPEGIACFVAVPVQLIGKFFRPLVLGLKHSADTLLRVLGVSKYVPEGVTEEEVKDLIEEGTQAGVFDKQEETIMKRALQVGDYTIEELMTPRLSVVGIDINAPIRDSLARMLKFNHSYFPVFDKDLDNPKGLLSIKSVLTRYIKKEAIHISECIVEPLFLPESMLAIEALEKFRRSSKHIAFVVDEHGGFAGIITVFDITESVFGNMPDSHELDSQMVVKRHDGSSLVDGRMHFDDFCDALSVPLQLTDVDDFQTLAGFVLAKLGKIPREGEFFSHAGFRFEVVDMDRKRIDKVLVTKL